MMDNIKYREIITIKNNNTIFVTKGFFKDDKIISIAGGYVKRLRGGNDGKGKED